MDLKQLSSQLKVHGFAKFIREHSDYLHTHTDVDLFATNLMFMEIIPPNDMHDLVGDKSDASKTSKIYAIISKHDNIELIMEAMKKSRNEHVLEFIQQELAKEYVRGACDEVVDERPGLAQQLSILSPRIQKLLSRGKFFEEAFLKSTLKWNAEELMAQDLPVQTSREVLKREVDVQIRNLLEQNAENMKNALTELQRYLVDSYPVTLLLFQRVGRERVGPILYTESLKFISKKQAREDQCLPEGFDQIVQDSEQIIQSNFETLRKAVFLYEKSIRTYVTKYNPLPSSLVKMYHQMAQAVISQELKDEIKKPKILSGVQSSLDTIFNCFCIQNCYSCASKISEDIAGIYVDAVSIVTYLNKEYHKHEPCVYVSNDGTIIYGNEANRYRHKHEEFFYDLLDLVGRDFRDPFIQRRLDQWPFKVTADRNGAATIMAHGKSFSPASLLSALIKSIITELNAIEKQPSVVKVAPSFNVRQRDAISHALKKEDIDVSEVSSLEYDVTSSYLLSDVVRSEPWIVHIVLLLVDFKETMCQFKLLKVSTQNEGAAVAKPLHFPAPNVLVSSDAISFGSRQFNENIAKHAIAQFKEKHGVEIAKPDMRILCETISMNWKLGELEENKPMRLHVSKFYRHLDLEIEIPAQAIVTISEKVYDNLSSHCCEFLDGVEVDLENIGHATICGDAPWIGVDHFERPVSSKCGHLVMASYYEVPQVAYNQSMIGMGSKLVDNILLHIPVSVGVQVSGGRMLKLVERGTKLPVQLAPSFNEFDVINNARDDNENEANVIVYAGEDELNMSSNVLLREFKFNPAGGTRVRCSVSVDINFLGQLYVKVHCQETGETRSGKVYVMGNSDVLGKEV